MKNPKITPALGWTLVLLVMAIVYLPILLLVYLSFADGLEYYVQLFTTTEYMSAVGNTLLIAVVASLIATIIAAMAATGILYLGKRTRAITMAVNQLPVINADIVTSFGLVLLFVSVGMTNFGLLKLLLAHVLIALPFCLLTILPKMRQLDANLIDAALDLGASPFKAFTSVIVPQLVPAMAQAFLLGFTLSLDDFVITQYNNSGVPTISTVVYGAISRRDIPDAFKALTTIIFIVILLVLVIMNLNAARLRKGIKISRRVVAVVLAVALLLTGAGIIPVIITHLTPRTLVLRIYNWEDYISTGGDADIDLIAEFEEYYRDKIGDNRFRVEYHTFTDNEELYSKLSTQKADYDLIFPSEYMVEKMAKEKLIQPINVAEIEHMGAEYVDQTILANTRAYTDVKNADNTVIDGQAWAIPYMVGTVGIMYDINVIEKMAPKTKISVEDFEGLLEKYGFGVLFGEGGTTAYKRHITMKKSARDSIGIAMIYGAQRGDNPLGDNPVANAEYLQDGFDKQMLSDILNMDGNYDIGIAQKFLQEQISTMDPRYENDTGKKSFMNPDDTQFAYGLFWSCDAGLAMWDAYVKNGYDSLRFYAPKGTNLWTDNFAIPTYAKNTPAAYAFIDFMLTDENAAVNTEYVGSQMIAVGEEMTATKEWYFNPIPDPEEEIEAYTEAEKALFANLGDTIFPTDDNYNYSAIMHNFDTKKEKTVNKTMLDIQNQAAEYTEKESGSFNLFLIVILILAAGAFVWWLVYALTHRRPRELPDPFTNSTSQTPPATA